MSETQLQTQVMQLAETLGWLAYHAPDNRPVTAASGRRYVQNVRGGFPDLVLVHPADGRLIFAELKREGRYPSAEQRVWLEALGNAAMSVVWRPRDLPAIARILSRQGADSAASRI